MSRRITLPVDAILQDVLRCLERNSSLVIEAPPGSGKTTRVPPALLGIVRGEVIVLEPRRIAARLAARRVAWELGEEVGGIVGYQVRFEEAVGPQTRLRFVTEGILTRRLLSDPMLAGVDAVILDEFHERHLDSDLALALLKRLQQARPELKIIVMSATLEAGPLARYLGDCPVLRSEGTLFDVAIQHLPYSPDPLPLQVLRAVELLVKEAHPGHILVLLPGAAEIRRTIRECEGVARKHSMLLLPLHGDLTPAEQDRAVAPTAERKLILATNVAESSVTIEGVRAVIDSGLARVATYSPWTGLPTLEIARVSKASAKQRAGRAGRTGPGRVLRLYAEEDYMRRAEQDSPEIVRSDLSQLCLSLRVMRFAHLNELDWLDEPPAAAVDRAESLLDRLEASGNMAQQLSRYPLTARLARVLVESLARGVGEDGCLAAGLLGSGVRSEQTDLLAMMDVPPDNRVRQHIEQLRRIARLAKQSRHEDDALLLSVLSGFPDRVARRRAGQQILLSTGVTAELAGERTPYEFMVAIDVEDRKEKPLPLVRMTSRIEPEWLIDLFPERMKERSTVIWNRSAERVEQTNTLLYDDLVIQESRGAASGHEAATLLAQMALEAGIERFVDKESLDNFVARLSFAGFEPLNLAKTLCDLCLGLQSFSELKLAAKNFIQLAEATVDTRALHETAPISVRLKNGRQTKVHYEHDRPPWISARMQDFFGMKDTPRIGPGKEPVVVHLLAPNQRAVQTTTDLAGFWERLYPQVRREMMRRYPRHAWPEKP